MFDPSIFPMLAVLRRELSRLVFLGLLCAYGLAALALCGGGGCGADLRRDALAILHGMRPYLWQGMALAYLLEFSGGFLAMTIGLAWDWWRQRPAKAAEKATATVKAEAKTELEKERAAAEAKLKEAMQEKEAAMREKEAEMRENEIAMREVMREKELELTAKDLEYRGRVVAAQEQALALRAMLVDNGINPDTGERMPNFKNGNGNSNGASGK